MFPMARETCLVPWRDLLFDAPSICNALEGRKNMRTSLVIITLAVALMGCPSSGSKAGNGNAADGGTSQLDAGGGGGSGGGKGGSGGGGRAATDGGTKTGGGTGGAGCAIQFMSMTTACVEFVAPSDYAMAKSVCESHGSTWLSACPAGKSGGCKVPPGAANGAPGGTIRWSYQGAVTCASGETEVDAQGAPHMTLQDAAAAIAVGPGGPVSAKCKTDMMTKSPISTLYPICMGNTICNACITTDYAAMSCETNKQFQDLFSFACLASPLASCATECGK